jgi:hypothetical protein
MRDAIYASLRPVRSRQRTRLTLGAVVVGTAAGAAATLSAAAAAYWLDIPRAVGVALLAAGPAVGLLAGLLARRTWHAAAAAVDTHYALKDRAVTALAFAAQPEPTPVQSLQLADAAGHLGRVEPAAVVPLAAPRAWPAALAGLAAAVAAVLCWPAHERQAAAALAPAPDGVVAVAEEKKELARLAEKKLAEMFADADDENAEQDKKGLKELMEKLAKKLEEMTENGMTEREALAKLSEMIAQNQAMLDQLNIAALDGQLGSLGTAMAATQAFEGAGKALQEGKLEKAVEKLEKLDEVKLTPKEAKALEEQLKQVSKRMGEAGLGSLGEATAELADSIKGGNGKVGRAAKNLAKKVNYAVKKRRAADLLNAVNEAFKEGKNDIAMNGGARVKQPEKSNDPSGSWGRGISLNGEGEKTKLGAKRTEVQVTGTPGGEGESDVETTTTPETREKAARQYAARYQKARKESEAVLEAEPIPLGHRQMVKKYFELIRPSAGGMAEKKDGDKKDPAKPDAGKK